MKVVSSLSAARDFLAGSACVLSIGNFDGLHLGHQAILQTVVQKARTLSLPAVAITFEPHPIQVLAPDRAPVPPINVCDANAASFRRFGSQWRRSRSVANVIARSGVMTGDKAQGVTR